MLRTKSLAGIVGILVAGFWLPATGAYETGLARTTTGGCVMVAWTEDPYVVSSPATGCTSVHQCVEVNWTTVPPDADVVTC